MDKRTDKNINDFILAVANRTPNYVTAYLFGSYAKGTQTEDSDIDLALVIDKLHDDKRFDLQIQLMLLASEFDLRIEPHPISSEDFDSWSPFAAEIKKTGIEITLLKA